MSERLRHWHLPDVSTFMCALRKMVSYLLNLLWRRILTKEVQMHKINYTTKFYGNSLQPDSRSKWEDTHRAWTIVLKKYEISDEKSEDLNDVTWCKLLWELELTWTIYFLLVIQNQQKNLERTMIKYMKAPG